MVLLWYYHEFGHFGFIEGSALIQIPLHLLLTLSVDV
ncbi:hypothetical protein Dfer_0868 [Dyadobacter fermentans DSM 18053]|uniref:Uncharacterized protein n=1 Tax=Dyadobacter fermentans (strain ATCC 700827 / DSM 18053 / CIP 107007 / KCTC 52180 / NS114) TaxID=471854 RepID=C6W2F0_DYAFD|nr:hypothetical protein Dfer_0868 [Dyadobacter fermentans DSM 18053]